MRKISLALAALVLLVGLCSCTERELPVGQTGDNGSYLPPQGGQTDNPSTEDGEQSDKDQPTQETPSDDVSGEDASHPQQGEDQTDDGLQSGEDEVSDSVETFSLSYNFSQANASLKDGTLLCEGLSVASSDADGMQVFGYADSRYTKYAYIDGQNCLVLSLPYDCSLELYAVNVFALSESVIELSGQTDISFTTTSHDNESGVRNSYEIFSCKVRKGDYIISSPAGVGLLYISATSEQ